MNKLASCIEATQVQQSQPVWFGDLQLFTEFHAILSPSHRRVIGFEGLARPRRQGKAVSPGELFREAASEGFEPDLDLALWQQFLAVYARADPNAWLFLNLSAASVGDSRTTPAALARQVHDSGFGCDRVVLEIIEDAISDREMLEQFVADCRDQGFRIAIDDFGAGDAHFERIWRMQPDVVKMDRTMVVEAASKPRASRLFLSLIRMIRENGSLVLIEGLETADQAALAWESEADFHQGFWYGLPTQCIHSSTGTAEFRLGQAREEFTLLSDQQKDEQIQFLRLLRYEVLAACQALAGGMSVAEASRDLLEMEGVQRCYILDRMGVQREKTAPALPNAPSLRRFNPLAYAEGASWSHREYFRNAIGKPGEIHLSRPYVALPDTARTVTISHLTHTIHGERILCIDIHPEQAFPGSHHRLPHHL